VLTPVKNFVRFLLLRFGYEIHRGRPYRPRRLGPGQLIGAGAKLNVGCGNKSREGYLGCDLRPLPTVDLACRAWEVPDYCANLEEIYSRHMLEHLTLCEADFTLYQWFRALAVGGRVHIIVPYFPFHVDQFLRAAWSEEELADRQSDARASLGSIFGWQRGCDPTAGNYRGNYWDVHKMGFDERLMAFLLRRAGFEEIELAVEDRCHLVARAVRRTANCGPFAPLFPRKQVA
jgi:hypothetical protein